MRVDEITQPKNSIYRYVQQVKEDAEEAIWGERTYHLGTSGGMAVMTRGDGFRYRDPAVIYADQEYKIYSPDDIQKVWNYFESRPDMKEPSFRIKGPFGSDKYKDVLIGAGKYLFIYDGNVIQYSTKSILRNDVIWKVEKK